MSSALLAADTRAGASEAAIAARQGWEANCASTNAVTKRGIAGVRSRALAHEMDGGQFRLHAARRDWPRSGRARLRPAYRPAASGSSQPRVRCRRSASARSLSIVAGREPGLLLELAHDAAGYVDRAVPDVVEIGRAGRKIDAPGVGGVLPISPSTKAPSAQRSAPMPKPLKTSRSGKPQSRQARKLAKSVSK